MASQGLSFHYLNGYEEHIHQIILAKKAFVELSSEERLMIATDLMDWFSLEEMASMFGYDNPESYARQMRRIRQKMAQVVEGKKRWPLKMRKKIHLTKQKKQERFS